LKHGILVLVFVQPGYGIGLVGKLLLPKYDGWERSLEVETGLFVKASI
jgi:hypothetical protein